MFDLLASGIANEWLQTNKILPAKYDPVPIVSTWQGLPLLNPPLAADLPLQAAIDQYLISLKAMGLNPAQQGVWSTSKPVSLCLLPLSPKVPPPLPL
jgi:hypothetical protein